MTQSEKHLLKKVTHQHPDDTSLFKISKCFIEGRCQFALRCFSEHASVGEGRAYLSAVVYL